MSIVPDTDTLIQEDSAVLLARYQQIIQYPPNAFWGVRKSGEDGGECRDLWSKMQRDTIAKYLAEAQIELEDQLGYFLSPRWVVGTLPEGQNEYWRYLDQQPYRTLMTARWKHIIATGQRAETDIEAGVTVDYSTEPATIGPIATTVTDVNEVHIFHPGTNVEVPASTIEIAGSNVTIRIPRARLVTEAAYTDSAANGSEIAYEDVGTCGAIPPVEGSFECAVDVRRVYNDASVNAALVYGHNCSSVCLASGCEDSTKTACINVKDARLGKLVVQRATYSDGAWMSSGDCCNGCPTQARLYYRAGEINITRQAEDTIVRLAHAKMPDEPCGCEIVTRLWARDRHIPEVLTRELANCPFGSSSGSWIAWRWCQAMREVTGVTM